MELSLYTLHSRGRVNELIAVGDGKRPLGLVPPLWAAWRGLWLTLIAMMGAMGIAAAFHPALIGTIWLGLIGVVVLDGASLERFELKLRGWKEVGLVEAASDAGAEELYLTGQVG